MSSSEIKEFFRNQTIFLTGGTGFLGTILLEKLLRVCYDLKIIYVLVRDKKGKSAEERFDDIFSSLLFDTLKKQQPEFKKKIKFLKGDCSELRLGLSEDDQNLIKKEVNVVFHSAAIVRFDQTLKIAAYNNVRAIKEILDLAKKIENLKAFVHVSTIFSNCHQTNLKEQFYDPPMQGEKLLNLLDIVDNETLARITPMLMGKWLNTYIYTKCIAEDLIKRQSGDLPICIVRPAIVMSTAEEPTPGWLPSLFGFGGLTAGVGVGALKTLNLNLDAQIPVVPCDYVANTCLAAAWNTCNESKHNQEPKRVKIYNFAGSNDCIYKWKDFVKALRAQRWRLCTNLMIWYPETVILENAVLFRILSFIAHTVPSYMADAVLICLGKPPLIVKLYKKFEQVLTMTEYFRTTAFKFGQENLEDVWKKMNETDRDLFPYDMKRINLQNYMDAGAWFARTQLLNDPPETLVRAKVKVAIFFCLHYGLLLLFLYFFLRFLLFFVGLVFSF